MKLLPMFIAPARVHPTAMPFGVGLSVAGSFLLTVRELRGFNLRCDCGSTIWELRRDDEVGVVSQCLERRQLLTE
jgi:hypothetical protein